MPELHLVKPLSVAIECRCGKLIRWQNNAPKKYRKCFDCTKKHRVSFPQDEEDSEEV